MIPTTASHLRRIVLLSCCSLVVSLISPQNGAQDKDAAAAHAPVMATTSASITATTSAISAATTAADPPSAAHPFSDPVWSPLRERAWVNCVRTNCPGPYHGYWAIDFIGGNGPLYAPGAGIFHVGRVIGKDTCSTTGVANSGTWVWIDHGGGLVTRYSHLYAVLAKEGQLVTPATMIGRMGHNGNRAPCLVNYLHLEYRRNGFTGLRYAPPAMLACTEKGRVSMPSQGLSLAPWDDGFPDESFATWDLVPTTPFRRFYTRTATNNCLATSRGAATPARPIVSARRGPASATISWGVVPADVNHTVATIELWHPNLGRYGTPLYRRIAGRAVATKFTGLLNGRRYRLRAATHNGAGYSAWTPYISVTPVAVPAVTRAPRALSTTRDAIRYAWWLPASNGKAITRFRVARRCVVRGSWTGWTFTNVAARQRPTTPYTLHYNWTGMPSGRTCQVTVRAMNSLGYGPWSTRTRATTLR